MSTNEAELLARCRSGDTEAFGVLYERHAEMVFRHAWRLLGNEEDAYDVRQETFVRAWCGIARFRGDSRVRTWLLTICTNLCRSRARRARARPQVDLTLYSADVSELPAATLCPAEALEYREQADAVWRALRGIPSPLREALILRDLEELGVDAVAQIMGWRRGSVSVMLSRARAMLRDRVRALMGEED